MTDKRDTPPAETGRTRTTIHKEGCGVFTMTDDCMIDDCNTCKCNCGANEPAETTAGPTPVCDDDCILDEGHTGPCEIHRNSWRIVRPEPAAAPVSPPDHPEPFHFWRTVERSGKWITECATCGIEREVAPVSPPQPVSAGTEPEVKLHDTMDAVVWAKEFKRICDANGHYCDEEWMVTWFANAIMVGWDFAKRAAVQSLSAQTPPNEQLVIDLARELYDRFVMGGWEPQDAYPQIRAMLAGSAQTGKAKEK